MPEFRERLDQVLKNYKGLQEALNKETNSSRIVEFSKDISELSTVANMVEELNSIEYQLAETKDILKLSDDDAELLAMAKQDSIYLQDKRNELLLNLQLELLPKDKDDRKNVILELRAGTGGDEAALFCGDLFKMYSKFADSCNWKYQVLSFTAGEVGGYREITLSIKGESVYRRLKFESGVHRVQRVPQTESSGRIHTSAATVAVLPEVEDVDIVFKDGELKIDVFRASGAGGQHVNTTESAVRITHLPTGIVVGVQNQRSQHQNKERAMKLLRARVYDAEKLKRDMDRSQDRRNMIGTGDRSERIRTYNFPQGRITDHRINLTVYKLEHILETGEINEIVDALSAYYQAILLSGEGQSSIG